MTEGERINSACFGNAWSPRKLAAEINAAIRRANPLADLGDRKLPPVIHPYAKKPVEQPRHIRDLA